MALAPDRTRHMMPWLLALYASASLLHFTHNAECLAQYPNLPVSWTRADVYLAWCGVTSLGLMGYVLYRTGYPRLGLILLAMYGALGFAGLLHYTRASIAHHSAVMNFTIWAEVVAATVFLVNVASIATQCVRRNAVLQADTRSRGP
jgi:hypothetical protein